ncbi:MAG: UrcA family protein [Sphingomicrobium sp.]
MMGMFLALAVGAALSANAPVATGEGAVQSVTVSYADLDLTTPHGRHALDSRVYAAAQHICGIDDYNSLPSLQLVAECSARIAQDTRPVVVTTIAQVVSGHSSIMAATGIIGK